MVKRAVLAGLVLSGVLSALWVSSVAAQDEQSRNSTVGTFAFDVEGAPLDELSTTVQVVEADADLADDNYAIGLYARYDVSLFVGFETLQGERWATFFVDYDSLSDQDEGTADPVVDGRLFVNDIDHETRVAIPFDWEAGTDYDFSLSAQPVAGGVEYVASLDGVEIGRQVVPAQLVDELSSVHSVVQRTDVFQSCDDAHYLLALIGDVSAQTADGAVVGELLRGVVEPESCLGSGVFLTDSQQPGITHELSGNDSLLSGPLGTGSDFDLAGNFVSGSAIDPDFPYCLANIDGDAIRRVCWDDDDDREAHIDQIIGDAANRPPGETIWIGRFDEEVVAP